MGAAPRGGRADPPGIEPSRPPHRACAPLLLLAAAPLLAGACLSPTVAARLMLVPGRSHPGPAPPLPHLDVSFPGEGVTLRGWLFPADEHRGTVVFLHGRTQNRSEGVRVAERLVPLGYDVLAYDSRAHGDSGGTYSTFGFWERRDLSRAIDFLGADRVIVMGVSLGGAVAVQGAAEDPRVAEVISVSAFASMRRVVRERVPPVIAWAMLPSAFRAAEALGSMRIAEADTEAAARRVHVPTLLLHGTDDTTVPPSHALRIQAALAGPSRLELIQGAGHGDVLDTEEAWGAILGALGPAGPSPPGVDAQPPPAPGAVPGRDDGPSRGGPLPVAGALGPITHPSGGADVTGCPCPGVPR